ncbi:6-bladed beta-propeller [Parabacteroides sp. Marseille-P3160]|uniref:6-bladed beta-propeller n=1 Tax=Parabacteroides sp. Marseille-P3160 TaxID=1917887 RepID=UPI00111884F3|nr:6-bladed beta-propeller [Parabacteroides sp. Marseille-P3160]
MKKACTFLLLLVFSIYLYMGYDLFRKNTLTEKTRGFLSDIAKEVVAVPLETIPGIKLEDARLIRRDGEHLFLVNNRQLYHFDISGRLVCRITDLHGEDKLVANYVVDIIRKQLIVITDRREALYYTYDGKLLAGKDLAGESLWDRLYTLSFYNGMFWAVVDKYVRDADDPSVCHRERRLCKYSTDFLELESRKLSPANLGRECSAYFDPEICVGEEGVYAYTPSLEPHRLLKDTLHILQYQGLFASSEAEASAYPVVLGKRFLLSSYYNAGKEPRTYTFCYDKTENIAYSVADGFQDDFYQTGAIPKLQPLDAYAHTFCFSKSGKDLKRAFPNWKAGDNPIVFLVRLKA